VIKLKTIVQSPGSATIINAISTGCGSAFGIKLYVTAEAEIKASNSSSITCVADGDIDTTLMEICVRRVVDRFKEHYHV
jgi:shikimate kinase